MRTLYLLRHGKSDQDDDRLEDHDRPLAPRGVRACARMGAWLAQAKPAPELVLCSSARRAVETLDRVLPHLETPPEVRVDRALYLAAPSRLLEALAGVGDSVEALLLVGHNPGVHVLAADLAEDGDPDAVERLSQKFPTAAVAVLRLPVGSWDRIEGCRGELLGFVAPRQLSDP